jgi:hypothetical protein
MSQDGPVDAVADLEPPDGHQEPRNGPPGRLVQLIDVPALTRANERQEMYRVGVELELLAAPAGRALLAAW